MLDAILIIVEDVAIIRTICMISSLYSMTTTAVWGQSDGLPCLLAISGLSKDAHNVIITLNTQWPISMDTH
jgi:hypothetical protein